MRKSDKSNTGLPAAAKKLCRHNVNEKVYNKQRKAIAMGRIIPGDGVSLRSLAREMRVSPMPVREAIQRLTAERALEMNSSRRYFVPEMTPGRFEELVKVRLQLEPEAAARALPHLGEDDILALEELDGHIADSLRTGNVDSYVRDDYAFHFRIYRAAASDVLVPMIESLWLQSGPFMRAVYGRVGTSELIGQRAATLAAIKSGDEAGLRMAIRFHIIDSMELTGRAVLEQNRRQGADGALAAAAV